VLENRQKETAKFTTLVTWSAQTLLRTLKAVPATDVFQDKQKCNGSLQPGVEVKDHGQGVR